MIQLAVALAALVLMGADGAHRLVSVPVKCPEEYHPPVINLTHVPSSSELADMKERGQLNGQYVTGRAVINNGRLYCNFGSGYAEQPIQMTNDPCIVDPNNGSQFLCQIDERLAPGGSLNPR